MLFDLFPIFSTESMSRVEHQQSPNKILQIAINLLMPPSSPPISRIYQIYILLLTVKLIIRIGNLIVCQFKGQYS